MDAKQEFDQTLQQIQQEHGQAHADQTAAIAARAESEQSTGNLVLTCTRNRGVVIGHTIRVKVVEIRGDRVRLEFQAPKSISVMREELLETSVNA